MSKNTKKIGKKVDRILEENTKRKIELCAQCLGKMSPNFILTMLQTELLVLEGVLFWDNILSFRAKTADNGVAVAIVVWIFTLYQRSISIKYRKKL